MDVIIEPTGQQGEQETMMSLDADLAHRVRLYLARVGHRPVQVVKVEARDGIVTLRGRVPSYYIRQLAVACAQRVAGVRTVNDQIRALVSVAQDVQPSDTQQLHREQLLLKGDRHDYRQNLHS